MRIVWVCESAGDVAHDETDGGQNGSSEYGRNGANDEQDLVYASQVLEELEEGNLFLLLLLIVIITNLVLCSILSLHLTLLLGSWCSFGLIWLLWLILQ